MITKIPIGKIASAKDVGDAVRDARKRMLLKQSQAAQLCGVGVRFLSDLENGKETLHIGKVLQVLDGLGLAAYVGTKQPFWTENGQRA
jgi:y4mF family transcriptional regulator